MATYLKLLNFFVGFFQHTVLQTAALKANFDDFNWIAKRYECDSIYTFYFGTIFFFDKFIETSEKCP